jgi:hypothetical protein
VAIVLVSAGAAWAWRGRRLRAGEFEVWGPGERP